MWRRRKRAACITQHVDPCRIRVCSDPLSTAQRLQLRRWGGSQAEEPADRPPLWMLTIWCKVKQKRRVHHVWCKMWAETEKKKTKRCKQTGYHLSKHEIQTEEAVGCSKSARTEQIPPVYSRKRLKPKARPGLLCGHHLLCSSTIMFCRLAGCLKRSDKNPQIKSTTPEQGITANNLLHLDGLDQQIPGGTRTNLRTCGPLDDKSIVAMQQMAGEKDTGY